MANLLRPGEREQVEQLARNASSPNVRRRAQLLLLYDEGLPTREVASRVGLSRGRSRFWRGSYQRKGMAIFSSTKDGAPSPDASALPEAAIDLGEAAIEKNPETAGPPEPAGEQLESTLTQEESRPQGDATLTEPGQTAGLSGEDHVPQEPKAAHRRRAEKRAREAEKRARDSERLESLLALEQPGVLPEDPLAEAGRKVLAFHFAEMLRHEQGTRLGEDIEELHDMRVATRRMRAAFEVFESAFEPQAIKGHLKRLRATGRALGRVRDLDVFMEKAQHYLDGLPEEQRAGLEPLLEAWRQEREAGRAAMLEHLDSEQYAGFIRKFAAFLTRPGEGVRLDAHGSPRSGQARHIAPALIYERLAAVRIFESGLESASIEQLHALRIEFKKLRYAIEFFRETLGKEAKEVIEALKSMQDHLGDLNDADVACQILRDFLDEWETRQLALPMSDRQNSEPIVAYLAAKHAERHRLVITFPEAWERFDRPELRRNLARAISVL